MTATDLKIWSDTVANAAQVVAIIVGGGWALWKFGLNREEWPRVTLEQTITKQPLDQERFLLRVLVGVKNAGNVLIDVEEVRVDVYPVLPLMDEAKLALNQQTLIPEGDVEARWPCIESRKRTWIPGEARIEPEESEPFGFDFVLPAEVKTIFVYSYVRNVKQREKPIGWSVTQFYDFEDGDAQPKMREAMAGRATD